MRAFSANTCSCPMTSAKVSDGMVIQGDGHRCHPSRAPRHPVCCSQVGPPPRHPVDGSGPMGTVTHGLTSSAVKRRRCHGLTFAPDAAGQRPSRWPPPRSVGGCRTFVVDEDRDIVYAATGGGRGRATARASTLPPDRNDRRPAPGPDTSTGPATTTWHPAHAGRVPAGAAYHLARRPPGSSTGSGGISDPVAEVAWRNAHAVATRAASGVVLGRTSAQHLRRRWTTTPLDPPTVPAPARQRLLAIWSSTRPAILCLRRHRVLWRGAHLHSVTRRDRDSLRWLARQSPGTRPTACGTAVSARIPRPSTHLGAGRAPAAGVFVWKGTVRAPGVLPDR